MTSQLQQRCVYCTVYIAYILAHSLKVFFHFLLHSKSWHYENKLCFAGNISAQEHHKQIAKTNNYGRLNMKSKRHNSSMKMQYSVATCTSFNRTLQYDGIMVIFKICLFNSFGQHLSQKQDSGHVYHFYPDIQIKSCPYRR